MTPGALERAAWRHPEWTAGSVALTAWTLLVFAPWAGGAAEHSHHAQGHGTPWLGSAAAWLLMSAAMMVPAALPAVRHAALTTMWNRRQRVVALFVVPYLALWLVFGILALAVVEWGRGVLDVGGPPLLAVALVVAAAWERTPLKRRALRAGHLVAALPPHGHKADAACVRAAMRYGAWSVAGCWALMLAMAVAGEGAVLLMALLAVVIAAEEVMVRGTRLGRPASAALLVSAVVAVVAA